jgi:hypothetical protein
MALSQDPVESIGLTVPALDRDGQHTVAFIPFAAVPFADLGGRELRRVERSRRTEAGNADRPTGSRWVIALARGVVVLWSPYGIASTVAALRSSRRRHSATGNEENEGRGPG